VRLVTFPTYPIRADHRLRDSPLRRQPQRRYTLAGAGYFAAPLTGVSMPFTGRDSPTTRPASLAVLFGIVAMTLLGGCSSIQTSANDSHIRQAAIERWIRCVERAAHDVPMNADARRSIEQGCAGHRRDVVLAFPPYMKQRLNRMLDERESRLTRTTFAKRGQSSTNRHVGSLAESLSSN